MLPFSVVIRSGVPVHDQVVFAVERAVVSGQLQPGDPFPSVRALSHELRINPNTAHRIISTLVRDQLLEVRPGTGTIVSKLPGASAAERRVLLKEDVERLVVAARKLSLGVDDVVDAVKEQWARLDPRRRGGTGAAAAPGAPRKGRDGRDEEP
jgi:GntR family transcriptional regulator